MCQSVRFTGVRCDAFVEVPDEWYESREDSIWKLSVVIIADACPSLPPHPYEYAFWCAGDGYSVYYERDTQRATFRRDFVASRASGRRERLGSPTSVGLGQGIGQGRHRSGSALQNQKICV